jgi:hypothetical protein
MIPNMVEKIAFSECLLLVKTKLLFRFIVSFHVAFKAVAKVSLV